MSPGLTPERLPTEIDAAFVGRYATIRRHPRLASAKAPSTQEAQPDALLNAGVFIPDTDK